MHRLRTAGLATLTFFIGASACASNSDQKDGTGGNGGAGAGAVGTISVGVGGGTGGGCNELNVDFEATTPTVLLLVDRSSSMFDQGYGGSQTRWQPLYDALMAPGGPVESLQGTIRFGFAAYTSGQGMCPGVQSIAPALDNYGAINTLFQQLSTAPPFKSETPTGAAFQEAVALLQATPADGSRYIILATDGEPDTCAHADPQCGQDESIKAVQDAFALGIRTVVIGIGDSLGAKHLEDLANAGDGQPVSMPDQSFINTCVNGGYASTTATYSATGGTAVYFQPTDQQALQAALGTAIDGVRSCIFELKKSVRPDLANRCQVSLDGQPLAHEVDWQLVSESELELRPSSCEALQTADGIDIACPCEAIVL